MWSTIVIKGLRRNVTAEQVERATGYKSGLADIRHRGSDTQAWIEVANDGREDVALDRATGRCEAAGLMMEQSCP